MSEDLRAFCVDWLDDDVSMMKKTEYTASSVIFFINQTLMFYIIKHILKW